MKKHDMEEFIERFVPLVADVSVPTFVVQVVANGEYVRLVGDPYYVNIIPHPDGAQVVYRGDAGVN